jgi:hypothetical protein
MQVAVRPIPRQFKLHIDEPINPTVHITTYPTGFLLSACRSVRLFCDVSRVIRFAPVCGLADHSNLLHDRLAHYAHFSVRNYRPGNARASLLGDRFAFVPVLGYNRSRHRSAAETKKMIRLRGRAVPYA